MMTEGLNKIRISPYGTWKSPVTADWIVTSGVGLSQPTLEQKRLFWLESRPTDGGRTTVVVRLDDGLDIDCVPAPYNVRSRVHEYGGGSYTVSQNKLYFVDFQDQQIYKVNLESRKIEYQVEQVTDLPNARFADLIVVGDELFCVMELHEDSQGSKEPVNSIVAVNVTSGNVRTLATGNDFYSFPRVSPDESRVVFTSWNHPNMPWNGTTLYLAELDNGGVRHVKAIVGGPEESIFQPSFGPDGALYYVSDRSNWWNLYRYEDGTSDKLLTPLSAEFGEPQWQFGQSTYGFVDESTVAAKFVQNGIDNLAVIDVTTGSVERIDAPYTVYRSVVCDGQRACFIAASPSHPTMLAELNLTDRTVACLKSSKSVSISDEYISVPEPISFVTADDQYAHGFYYPPANPKFAAPSEEKPPLIVMSHGGPTGSTDAMFNLGILYWTTRGVAVLDVNYRGSTGYGRDYREQLNGVWGIADVDDCCNGAIHLVGTGKADAHRLAITGGSAGGYTTLAALTFRDTFATGASHYGVSDISLLAKETHKFESRYPNQLIGPYPEAKDLYEARSPIHHVEQMDCPVIFFQGEDDKVVPPNQAELMVEVLRQKGVPVAYVLYEGEGHGFRKAEHIKHALEAQLYFFGRIFGFEPADDIDRIQIVNEST